MSGKYNEFSNLSTKQKRRRLEASIHRERTISENNTSDSNDEENARFENPPIQPSSVRSELESDESQNLLDNSSASTEFDDIFEFDIEEENVIESDVSEHEVEAEQFNDPREIAKRILKNAFLSAGLKHTQGNILLKTLREFPFNLNYLPKDSRTLLNTPTIVASSQIQIVPGGEYLHIGFKKTLMQKLNSLEENMLPERIIVDLSTDGAKINKGMDQYWPIQYRIYNICDKRVVIAGIYKGKHKPSNPFDFFNPVVQEIVQIQDEGGVRINDKQMPLEIRCFIADAPARAFILNHFGHNSLNPCSKCKVEGSHCSKPGFERVMVFLGTEHASRNDADYFNVVDEDHQKGESPIAPILPLVSRVPFDPMHLVWIGCVKKILSSIIDGNFGFQRLNYRKIEIMNSRMLQIDEYCPSEFNRRPKEISLYKHFKATEFRQLALYTAPGVFKNVLLQEFYDHFMLLNSTMRLLGSENVLPELKDFCKMAVKTFVTLCVPLFGEQFMSYNLHGMLHTVEDVEELGPQETFSAFDFENNMPEIRKLVRKPHLTLQQIYKRICEINGINLKPLETSNRLQTSQNHVDGPLPPNTAINRCLQYHKLEIGKFTFATTLRDSCCVIKDGRVGLIVNIVKIEGDMFFIMKIFRTVTSIYNVGITSESAGVYCCSNLSNTIATISLNEIKTKCYRIPEWSDVDRQEEMVVPDTWICVTFLSPLVLPNN